MKRLLSKKDREDIILLCSKWINVNLTLEEVKDTINMLDWAVDVSLPQLEDAIYASSAVRILIDDIMEIESLSDTEKDQAILELVEQYKEELQSLAGRVIEQIKKDIDEYNAEAEKSGYCPELMKHKEE